MNTMPEIENYLHYLERLREHALKTLDGLDERVLNWKPLEEETNSLYALATHVIGSEHGWIYEVLGRGEKTRDRPAEFAAKGSDLAGLRARYEATAKETSNLLAFRTSEDLETTREHEKYGLVTERWIILHVIEHYAEHIGQMYLTRQLALKHLQKGA